MPESRNNSVTLMLRAVASALSELERDPCRERMRIHLRKAKLLAVRMQFPIIEWPLQAPLEIGVNYRDTDAEICAVMQTKGGITCGWSWEYVDSKVTLSSYLEGFR